MKKQRLLAITVVLPLLLGACDSTDEAQREQALEDRADRLERRADIVRQDGEDAADGIGRSDPGVDSDAMERAAEAVRNRAKTKADALEDTADELRDRK